MEADEHLIMQIEALLGGDMVHSGANWIAAYRAAVEEYRATRAEEYYEIAQSAESALRGLLARLRLRKLIPVDMVEAGSSHLAAA